MSAHVADASVPEDDPLLAPLRRATDDAAREHEIARLITTLAEPLTRRVAARYSSGAAPLTQEDVDDLVSAIDLVLIRKLRGLDEPIRDLASYIATLAYNAIHDHFRRHYPQWTRLKNRLRYVLTEDGRLALWTIPAGPTAGLAPWRGRGDVTLPFPLPSASRTMLDRDHPADAVTEILRSVNAPVLLNVLVEGVAELWNVTDAHPLRTVAEEASDDAGKRLETRDFLRALWSEVRELPLPQRKALLLNLRDSDTANAISILALSGIATFDEIAGAMELAPEALGELWNRLPLDDATIAGMLGLSRQQVINLRKSARERLARRLFRRKR